MTQQANKTGSMMFLMGAVMGSALTLLFNSSSVEKMKQDFKRKAEEAKENMKNKAENTRQTAEEKLNKGKVKLSQKEQEMEENATNE